jgi:hypothetical protein
MIVATAAVSISLYTATTSPETTTDSHFVDISACAIVRYVHLGWVFLMDHVPEQS